MPITGRIVDLEGQPVAGVVVKVGSVLYAKNGRPDAVARRSQERRAAVDREQARRWIATDPEKTMRQATTDKDGRFRLDGFGADRVVGLELQGGTIAYTTIDVATRKMDPIPARAFRTCTGRGTKTIYGADFTYTATPSRPIEGDREGRQDGSAARGRRDPQLPVRRVELRRHHDLEDQDRPQGRFRLAGLPKGKGTS